MKSKEFTKSRHFDAANAFTASNNFIKSDSFFQHQINLQVLNHSQDLIHLQIFNKFTQSNHSLEKFRSL